MAEVYGVASDVVMNGHGMLESWSLEVPVPENALAAVTKGFCPADLVPLNEYRWCPVCKVYWHIRKAA